MRITKMPMLTLILVLAFSADAVHAAEPVASEEKKEELDVNNPVRRISEMMKKAAELLEKLETGSPTQEEQKKILEELDRLIEMAEQSSSSSSQQQQQQEQKPSDPRNTSEPRNTSGSASSPVSDERDILRQVGPALGPGAPDLRDMWGKLPDAQRDEVLQLLREKLPLKYKQLLIWYFKALSEKK